MQDSLLGTKRLSIIYRLVFFLGVFPFLKIQQIPLSLLEKRFITKIQIRNEKRIFFLKNHF